MTTIKDEVLNDTIKYNDVTFGGADTNMMPPTYRLTGSMVYDDAGRNVIGVSYSLTVQTVVFGSTESETTDVVESLRDKLSTPGKTLELDGLGLGFSTDPSDITWGPKPISFDTAPVGSNIAIEIIWIVEFTVNHCASTGADDNTWMAFNYATDWGYDFEGQGMRTIRGYVQVAQTRAGDVAKHVADAVRDRIRVIVPVGFRRDSFTFTENASKDRITFAIRDVQLDAEAPPPDVTEISGDAVVTAEGIAGVTGTAALRMSLTTAPGVPRNTAARVFFAAAMKKQLELNRDIRGRGALGGRGQALPVSMTLGHSLYTRKSTFQMVWSLTGCAFDALAKGGVWVPVTDGNYNRWKASMDRLWVNRGSTDLGSVASEDVIINLCTSTLDATVGARGRAFGEGPQARWRYSCPEVPPEASWLFYEFRLRVLRVDHNTLHRLAAEFIPGRITSVTGASAKVTRLLTGVLFDNPGGEYTIPTDDAHAVEYNGFPTVRIVAQLRGLRVQHVPVMPQVESVAGQPVNQIWSDGYVSAVGQAACHPIYFINQTVVYEVTGGGYVPTVRVPADQDVCGAPVLEKTTKY